MLTHNTSLFILNNSYKNYYNAYNTHTNTFYLYVSCNVYTVKKQFIWRYTQSKWVLRCVLKCVEVCNLRVIHCWQGVCGVVELLQYSVPEGFGKKIFCLHYAPTVSYGSKTPCSLKNASHPGAVERQVWTWAPRCIFEAYCGESSWLTIMVNYRLYRCGGATFSGKNAHRVPLFPATMVRSAHFFW